MTSQTWISLGSFAVSALALFFSVRNTKRERRDRAVADHKAEQRTAEAIAEERRQREEEIASLRKIVPPLNTMAGIMERGRETPNIDWEIEHDMRSAWNLRNIGMFTATNVVVANPDGKTSGLLITEPDQLRSVEPLGIVSIGIANFDQANFPGFLFVKCEEDSQGRRVRIGPKR